MSIFEGFALRRFFDEISEVTPQEIVAKVRNNERLFAKITEQGEEEARSYGGKIKRLHLAYLLEGDRPAEEFEKRRPDLFSAVKAEPGGRAWFEAQMHEVRVKLGLVTEPVGRFRMVGQEKEQ